jgi:hypothetical protein
MGDKRKYIEEKRSIRRPICKWEDNIKINEEGGRAWIGFIWLRIGTSGELL